MSFGEGEEVIFAIDTVAYAVMINGVISKSLSAGRSCIASCHWSSAG
jgi:hypothetical protein